MLKNVILINIRVTKLCNYVIKLIIDDVLDKKKEIYCMTISAKAEKNSFVSLMIYAPKRAR